MGGAEISDKHADFIVNKDKATAQEVMALANLVKEKVYKRYGFNLEEEVVVV